MKLTTKSGYIIPALASVAYSPFKKIEVSKHGLLRKLAKDLSLEVQIRLEWVIFYETVGKLNAAKTAKYFGISRKTFHKWYKPFKEGKYRLESLENRSRAPIHVRKWEVTATEEERVIKLRKEHLRYGKKKLKRLYLRFYGEVISTWKIERVIRKHKLFPDPVKHKRMIVRRAKEKENPRIRIKSLPKPQSIGEIWHIDSIILNFGAVRRAIITGIDDVSKIAYGRMYVSDRSKSTKDFIQRLKYLTEGNISVIHTDNGSEFDGYFAQICSQLNIPRVYSRPHTPKDNPVNERFNRTIQEDWLDGAVFDPQDLTEANKSMTEWLVEYNTFRPHEALDQLTPAEYVEANLKVLPMSPARTQFDNESNFM
jgi:putative transposase